jgi:pantetheine-phosphate adenylyltransferase
MRAIYPGTFDPITNGHFDIIKRATKLFSEVVVAVAGTSSKNTKFSLDNRIAFVKEAIEPLNSVSVLSFDTLLVDFVREQNSFIVIRGLRTNGDFEYELQMQYANTNFYPELETIYLASDITNGFVSSTIVRSVLSCGGDVSNLVPKGVNRLIKDSQCM